MGVSRIARFTGDYVGQYIHTVGGKLGVQVEFSGVTPAIRNRDEFKSLVREVTMHIAAANPSPQYLTRDAVPADVLSETSPGEPSATVRARVVAARARQRARYDGSGVTANARLTPPLITEHCRLDTASVRLLSAAVQRLGLTARGYERVRKVARTIADLEGVDDVRSEHVAEALQFRMRI